MEKLTMDMVLNYKNKAEFLFNYANKLGKRLSKEYEDIILTDPYYTLRYAIQVVKKRWKKGEIYLLLNENYLNNYMEQFQLTIYDIVKPLLSKEVKNELR